MPSLEDVTNPLVQILLPVPRVGPGVCTVCHRAPNPGFTTCYSCAAVTTQVSRPAGLIVPISLYVVGEQLHTVLRGYKDSPMGEVRDRFSLQVAAFAGRFLRDHGACIRLVAGGGWDAVTTVPSTHGRAGPHPLRGALQRITGWEPHLIDCLAPSGLPLEHNQASDAAYTVTEKISGLRVLLVDDTYTTGAHIHSAASALQLAGADVVAAVVVGRVIDPSFNTANADLLKASRGRGFKFDRCCLEVR